MGNENEKVNNPAVIEQYAKIMKEARPMTFDLTNDEEVRIVRGLNFPVEIYISDNLNTASVTVAPHWHEYYEILFVLEGELVLMQNGAYHLIRKDDIVVTKPGEVHATAGEASDDIKMFVIKFLPEIIQTGINSRYESKYLTAFLEKNSSEINHIDEKVKEYPALQRVMLTLVEEFENKGVGYELYIKGLLFELIACLVRMGIVSKKSSEATAEDMMFLDKLLKFIEQNLGNDISREKAAKFMCMSLPKFSEFFKKTTGQTFGEYINYARVSEAERMIVGGKMRIQQAAFEVGFQSVQTFIRTFKRIKGYTPGLLLHEK